MKTRQLVFIHSDTMKYNSLRVKPVEYEQIFFDKFSSTLCQIFFDDIVHEIIFGKWYDEDLCMLAFVKFPLTNENVAKVPSYTSIFISFSFHEYFLWQMTFVKKICLCTTGLTRTVEDQEKYNRLQLERLGTRKTVRITRNFEFLGRWPMFFEWRNERKVWESCTSYRWFEL